MDTTNEQKPMRDAQGRLLPGVRLNPHGRPRAKMSLSRKEIFKILDDEDFNPIKEFIRIARHPDASLYVQMEATERIASYILPKIKQVQITNAEGDGDGTIHISWDTSPAALANAPQIDNPDVAAKQFSDAMSNATQTVLDAVAEAILDDDDQG